MIYLYGVGGVVLAVEVFDRDVGAVHGAVAVGVTHPLQLILERNPNTRLWLSRLHRSLCPFSRSSVIPVLPTSFAQNERVSGGRAEEAAAPSLGGSRHVRVFRGWQSTF